MSDRPRSSVASKVPAVILCWVFFFQAEEGIRDLTVTGVQTCALPISAGGAGAAGGAAAAWGAARPAAPAPPAGVALPAPGPARRRHTAPPRPPGRRQTEA